MVSEQLFLTAGRLRVRLDPSIGGSIGCFDFLSDDGPVAILRRASDDCADVLVMACFPLVPYVNRIRGGTFEFGGRTITIKPNMAGDISPLHGQGWLNPWRVAEAGPTHALLEYDHAAGEWPWSYRATQQFQLDENSLTIELSCTNRSQEPMPCGLGQHPYFDCTKDTVLRTKVQEVWTIDEHVLPVDRVPATGRYDLSDRAVCGLGLDHGFGGWDGVATMDDPAWPFTMEMSSPTARFFQLYSPAAGAIFVAEPVTHANAALNQPVEKWPQLGLTVLAPGQSMSLMMRLALTPR